MPPKFLSYSGIGFLLLLTGDFSLPIICERFYDRQTVCYLPFVFLPNSGSIFRNDDTMNVSEQVSITMMKNVL